MGSTCTCGFWADPCPHALAVLYQLAWLLEADPLVLLHLRGLPRDDLLARLHDRGSAPGPDLAPADPGEVDLDLAADAALRAEAMLGDLPPL
nr:SWIM zinc finger family protein [Nocardioides flavescens]